MSLHFESLDNHLKSVRNYTAAGTNFKVEMTQHTHLVQSKSIDDKPVMKKEDKYVDIKICNGIDLVGLDMQKIKVLRGALQRATNFLVGGDSNEYIESPSMGRSMNMSMPVASEVEFID